MLIINYFVYFKTGTVYYGFYSATDSNEMWLYINMIFPLIVCMGLLLYLIAICIKESEMSMLAHFYGVQSLLRCH